MNKITKDEALKLALKSLEGLADYRYTERVKQALAAIREALAEPSEALASGANEQPAPAPEVREQQEPDYNICPTCGGMASDPIVPPEYRHQSAERGEPVAWIYEFYADRGHLGLAFEPQRSADNTPLYSAPQPLRGWVGLTDEEIINVAKSIDIEFKDEGLAEQVDDILTFARAIEAKLKEKNGF